MHWIDAKLRALEPVLGTKKVMKLRQWYLIEESPRDKKEVENYIDILTSKHVNTSLDEQIILPPTDSNIPRGDVHLGMVSYLNKDRFNFNIT